MNGRLVNGRAPRDASAVCRILPDRHRKKQTFEYVINDLWDVVSIFDHPMSMKSSGTIN